MDLLSQIIEWASSTTYCTKIGNRNHKMYIKGYEQGIADAKARIFRNIKQRHNENIIN